MTLCACTQLKYLSGLFGSIWICMVLMLSCQSCGMCHQDYSTRECTLGTATTPLLWAELGVFPLEENTKDFPSSFSRQPPGDSSIGHLEGFITARSW